VKFGIRSVSTGSLSNVKSDLNLRGDFSIRKNKTVLRRIDEDVNQVSTGQQVLSINLSADYMVNSRLNIRVFFDKVINDPYVSSQFHNSTTNGGISLKFTLAQ
jgi:cell surface protein SprA